VSHLIFAAGGTRVALVLRRNARRRGSCEREARVLSMLGSISAALARCVRGRGAQVPVDVLPGLLSWPFAIEGYALTLQRLRARVHSLEVQKRYRLDSPACAMLALVIICNNDRIRRIDADSGG
jgi:hypothetical protein